MKPTNFMPQFPNGPPANIQGNSTQMTNYSNLFNNANYGNYYNATEPYSNPMAIPLPSIQSRQDLIFKLMNDLRARLEYSFKIVGALCDMKPEVNMSYLMAFPVFITHLQQQLTASFTTIEGKGDEITAPPLKQVTLKPAEFLSVHHKVAIFNYASPSEGGDSIAQKGYVMAGLEGLQRISRKVVLTTIESLLQCYNYLDHLSKSELMNLAAMNIRGIGILDRKDRMPAALYFTNIVKALMAASVQDFIMMFYPQAMLPQFLNPAKYVYSTGEELLEQNLQNLSFISVEPSESSLFGGKGTIQLLQNPILSTFTKPVECVITYTILRMCYLLKGIDIERGLAVVPAGNFNLKRVLKAYINSLLGKPDSSPLPDYILYIQSEMVMEGHPVSFAASNLGGQGPKPLQSFKGHTVTTEGEDLNTITRQFIYQTTYRSLPSCPDITRNVGSVHVENSYLNNDPQSIVYSKPGAAEIAVAFGNASDAQSFINNIKNSGSDIVPWYSIDTLIGSANALKLKGTSTNWVTTYVNDTNKEEKNFLRVSFNNSNAQTGCLLSHALLTPTDTSSNIIFPPDMTKTYKELFPSLINSNLNFEDLKDNGTLIYNIV